MPTLKLKVAKVSNVNPKTKQKGLTARVQTNGTADFDDIVKDAGRNTTMHKAELRMAFELCLDSVVDSLKQGYIVDLGPLGKIYPSCQSGWYEKEEDMKLSDINPTLYYRAADEVALSIKSASLMWAKASDEENDDNNGGGDTPAPSPSDPDTPSNPDDGGDEN